MTFIIRPILIFALLLSSFACTMKNVSTDSIPIPPQAQKAVFDGAFASPLIRTLTTIRSGLKGDFDEEVYLLPATTEWVLLEQFYEKELTAAGWQKKDKKTSEVTNLTTLKYEQNGFFTDRELVVAFVGIEAADTEHSKFLALFIKK